MTNDPRSRSDQRHNDVLWAEIDLAAIAHNVRELRRVLASGTRLMVAVKANAYGHGAAAVARTALAHGADALGVARIDEAIGLRQAGLKAPILVFGPTPAGRAAELIGHDLTQTVSSLDQARTLSDAGQAADGQVVVHLKVDTGMGRLGLLPGHRRAMAPAAGDGDPAVAEVRFIDQLPGLRLEGICSHFASSDSADKHFARQQLADFMAFVADLEKSGIRFALCHMANSGAIFDLPEAGLDMVRAGISLYGLYPSDQVAVQRLDLRPAMQIKARIAHLKTVPAGCPVSYGSTYVTPRATTIATIPIGYADGYSRRLSNRGQMLAAGQRAPVVGRVCMDLTMIDVGHITGLQTGDEVVVLGRQGDGQISADEIAGWLDTINYEVVSVLAARVPRVYLPA